VWLRSNSFRPLLPADLRALHNASTPMAPAQARIVLRNRGGATKSYIEWWPRAGRRCRP
jgi:hypothetical protein